MAHDTIPLTEIGHQQACTLATLLPQTPSKVWASPFVRAQDTAQPYCERVGQSATVLHDLHEFNTIDPDLLQGMTGTERGPVVDAYWAEADPKKRMGVHAETFIEFERRVDGFQAQQLDQLTDSAVVFGHGMWMCMLVWKLLGFTANDGIGMKAFRRFQLGLPVPNGAVYRLAEFAPGHWTASADEAVMRRMMLLAAAVTT